MSNTHSKVRQTWFRFWAALAVLIMTWSAGDRLADRFLPEAAAGSTASAQGAEAAQPARTAGVVRLGDGG